jgi:hypothetical protein
VFRKLFIVNVVSVLGMTISFLLEGYGPVSITFSTIHLLSSYVYARHYLRYLKSKGPSTARYFLRWAIYWQLISTIGLWAMAPVMTMLGKLHPLYSATIQFFLHFQMNGWFTFVVLGLLFHFLGNKYKEIELRTSTLAMLQISLVFTYFLSVTWSTPMPVLFYINSFGVALQLWAFIRIFKAIHREVPELFSFKGLSSSLLTIGLFSMLFKVLIQSALVLPQMAVISYTIHNFVIAFIHLIMLGSITFGMAGILLKKDLLPTNALSKSGWCVLLVGFLVSEAVLFSQGLMLWMGFGFISNYYMLIFGVSVLLPIGVGLLLWGIYSNDKTRVKALKGS